MAVEQQFTPLPVQRVTPAKFVIADWHDLGTNDTEAVLDTSQFGSQHIEIDEVGARPEPEVEVEVQTTSARRSGEHIETQTHQTTALGAYNNPLDRGPTATNRIQWRTRNRSGANSYTQGGGNPYQAYLGYTVRNLTVIDKLRRGIGLTQAEQRLAREQFGGKLSLRERQRLNVPPERDPIYEPTLDGKVVLKEDAEVTTVDISSTGAANAVTVADERVRTSGSTPRDILYLTGLAVNSQEYSAADDLTFQVTRGGTENFWRLKTFGLPGQGDGTGVGAATAGVSEPPFEADVFVPFLDRMTVAVYAQNAINNVDVRVEFARVDRTLVEKALYGLEDQVKADDDLADRRSNIYESLRDKLHTGLSIEVERERAGDVRSEALRA